MLRIKKLKLLLKIRELDRKLQHIDEAWGYINEAPPCVLSEVMKIEMQKDELFKQLREGELC